MSRSKDLGREAENAVVGFLRKHGFPHAERRAQRGTNDAGDITGCPGLVIEVKGGRAAEGASDGLIEDWLAETERERVNAGADLGLLVVKRAGVGSVNAGRWWAIVDGWRAEYFFDAAFTWHFPIRLHLADAVDLLRCAGYGNPLEGS